VKDLSLTSRHIRYKLLLGLLAGGLSYVLLLWLHGPWEEIVAAVLVGSVVGVADLSPIRILMGSAACALGWFLGSMIFGVWMELGVGAWLIAGAFLGAAFGACRGWWTAISVMLLGLIAGLLAEASRFLTVLVTPLRSLDMQLLLLLSAGLLLNLLAALAAPSVRTAHATP